MLALALTLAAAPVQAPIIVDPSSGLNLQLAIDSAPDGATLLILPGTYGETTIAAKSLTLIGLGAQPDEVVVTSQGFQFGSAPGLSVRQLASDQRVNVSNLLVTSASSGGMSVSQNAGSVVLSDLVVVGQTEELSPTSALSVRNSSSVWLDGVEAVLLPAALSFVGLGAAVVLEDSTVVMTDCHVEAATSLVNTGLEGGVAVGVEGSIVNFYNCELVGGDALNASGPFEPPAASKGGAGLHLVSSVARWAGGPDNLILGGQGFSDLPALMGSGAPAVLVEGGSTFASDAAALLVPGVDSDGAVTSPAIELGSGPNTSTTSPVLIPRVDLQTSLALPGPALVADLEGEPGAALFVVYSFGPASAFALPGFSGLAVVSPVGAGQLPLQTLNSQGTGQISGNLPANPLLSGLQLVFQGVQFAPLGPPQISAPTGLTILF